MEQVKHKSVLLKECIDGLAIKECGTYVDATLGRAGHSCEILRNLNGKGFLYGFDQDEFALKESKEILEKVNDNFKLIDSNFVHLKNKLLENGVEQVDGFLFDLGVSSPQFDEGERGFSYNYNAFLDMRMDQRNPLSAHKIINTYEEEEIASIIYRYGEERFSRQIARVIAETRKTKSIETTFDLVDCIKKGIPAKFRIDGGHPAKRTFQAIRIAVNQELEILRSSLMDAAKMLKKEGRLCVISFHSLEDRIVKELFKELTSPPSWNRGMPVSNHVYINDYILINKKPIEAGEEELAVNKRAHSAKLRILQRK